MAARNMLNLKSLAVYLLHGAKGDMRQIWAGGFYYHPAGLPADCASPELVRLNYESRTLTLTPAGANFILENIWDTFNPSQIRALQRYAASKEAR